MNMHKDMFNNFKSTSMWMKMKFTKLSKKMSMWLRVNRLDEGNCVMGITVLIVTAVSTSYKREASPVDWEEEQKPIQYLWLGS